MGIYASVMGTGKIRVVTDLTEKRKAIDLVHTRYKDVADYYSIKDETLDKVVNVHALEIAELTGKIKGYYNPDKPNARFMIVQDW